MNKRIILKIYGDVQGVFFRSFVKDKADDLKLVGWVKNNPDGTLNIVAEGEGDNLDKFLDWCRKGPEMARVENIEKERGEGSGEFNNFEIL